MGAGAEDKRAGTRAPPHQLPHATVTLGALLILGCGSQACSSNAEPPAEATRDDLEADWCRASCNLARECYSVSYWCADDCLERNEEYLARTTSTALFYEAECFEDGARCSDENDVERQMSECFEEASEQSVPTQDSYELCESLATTLYQCHWFADVASCAQFFARFVPNRLRAARQCAEVGCDELGDCFEMQVWRD